MKRIYIYAILFLSAVAGACGHKEKEAETVSEPEAAQPRTPVTVTSVKFEPLEDYVELNATSTFLQKTIVKATTTGYIKYAAVHFNSLVTMGQTLFTLKTKEAESIGNTINKLNPGFKFSGVNEIRANATGYITELNHQLGDYVQDNEQLGVISNLKSFVFVLNLPYEYRQLVMKQKNLQVTLPDGERLLGTIQQILPSVDSLTQTQSIAIKVNAGHPLPQNLVAKVKIIKNANSTATTLPKSAVLSDETQSDFWVMKVINDSTAVKVPVKKGIETQASVEIVAPAFNPSDKILLTGNFGLSDTAKILIGH